MALSIGTKAPEFSLPASNRLMFHFPNDVKGQPVILYFYPKDFSPGCTAESCGFRDQFDVFEELGVKVYGISHDDVETHIRFINAYHLPFELLSDPERKVINLYKAKFPLVPFTRRLTYFIDHEGIIRACHEGLFDGKAHVKQMLKTIQTQFVKSNK